MKILKTIIEILQVMVYSLAGIFSKNKRLLALEIISSWHRLFYMLVLSSLTLFYSFILFYFISYIQDMN